MSLAARKINQFAKPQSAVNPKKPDSKKLKRSTVGRRYMPLKLKKVLAAHGLRQSDWQGAITQQGGRGEGRELSSSAGTSLLNWGTWPKLTAADSIAKQTEYFLRERGVSENDIAIIWQEDVEDEGRNNYPKGVHRGKQKSKYLDQLPEAEMLSQTARQHFRISTSPFTDDINCKDDIYLSADQQYIRGAMYQTAKRGGFLAVVGESGSGKSTLRRDLLDRISREELPVVAIQPETIDKTRLTAGAICEAIIRDISDATPKQSLEGKARQIKQLLTSSSRGGNSHVLILEEAHDITISTLKYLKRFWELEDGYTKLISIILIGQPELKDKLDVKQHWEAREVINRCEVAELRPLGENLEKYLDLKFSRVESRLEEIFTPDAYDALRARCTLRRRGNPNQVGISMLYPLIVNLTVTKAMNLAAEMGEPKVTAEVIEGV